MDRTNPNSLSINDIDENTDLRILSADQSMGETKPIYCNEQIEELLRRVGTKGTSLKKECDEAGINYNTVYWRVSHSDELTKLDTYARERSLDFRVRELNELVDKEDDPQIARLKCDNIKWEAARVLRKLYGEHVTVETKDATYGDKTTAELEEMAKDYIAHKQAKLGKDG